jgi:hypothetical protein
MVQWRHALHAGQSTSALHLHACWLAEIDRDVQNTIEELAWDRANAWAVWCPHHTRSICWSAGCGFQGHDIQQSNLNLNLMLLKAKLGHFLVLPLALCDMSNFNYKFVPASSFGGLTWLASLSIASSIYKLQSQWVYICYYSIIKITIMIFKQGPYLLSYRGWCLGPTREQPRDIRFYVYLDLGGWSELMNTYQKQKGSELMKTLRKERRGKFFLK